MKLWKTERVHVSTLERTLNQLELDDWEIFSVLPEGMGALIVARREASRWDVEDALNTAPPWQEEARALVAAGKKIAAIKLVREHTGQGLKEAKDYVEREL